MSTYKIDLAKLKQEATIFLKKAQSWQEEYNQFAGLAENIDSTWSDNNTLPFIEQIKKEQKDVSKLITYFDAYKKEIHSYATSIETLFRKNGLAKSDFYLNYNSEATEQTIQEIEQSNNTIAAILKKLEYMNRPRSSSAYYDIIKVKEIYRELNKKTNQLKEKTKNIVQGLYEINDESKRKILKLEKQDIIDNQLKFSWQTVSAVKDYSDIYNNRQIEEVSPAINNVNFNEVTIEMQPIENSFSSKSQTTSIEKEMFQTRDAKNSNAVVHNLKEVELEKLEPEKEKQFDSKQSTFNSFLNPTLVPNTHENFIPNQTDISLAKSEISYQNKEKVKKQDSKIESVSSKTMSNKKQEEFEVDETNMNSNLETLEIKNPDSVKIEDNHFREF